MSPPAKKTDAKRIAEARQNAKNSPQLKWKSGVRGRRKGTLDRRIMGRAGAPKGFRPLLADDLKRTVSRSTFDSLIRLMDTGLNEYRVRFEDPKTKLKSEIICKDFGGSRGYRFFIKTERRSNTERRKAKRAQVKAN